MSRHQRNYSTDTANEEWPEMIASDFSTLTFVSSQHRLSPANPTPKIVEVSNSLSAQDLKSLKKEDPFLYYSIPGVRDATVRLEHVDMHQVAQNGLKRYCQSCPGEIQTSCASEPVAKVERCTRVSFEYHTDLLLEDQLFNDFDDTGKVPEDLSLEEERPFDYLFKLFERA